MLENRRHFRLREFIEVAWKVADQEVSGEGTVINISASGLLLQTDRMFRPTDNCYLTVESGAETLPFAPKKGKIVWFRRIYSPKERLQCGIQFSERTDNVFLQWLEKKINKLSEVEDVRNIR